MMGKEVVKHFVVSLWLRLDSSGDSCLDTFKPRIDIQAAFDKLHVRSGTKPLKFIDLRQQLLYARFFRSKLAVRPTHSEFLFADNPTRPLT